MWNEYKKPLQQAQVTNSLPANSNITDDRVKFKYATNDTAGQRNRKVKITEGPIREAFKGVETVDLITNSLPMNLDLNHSNSKGHQFSDIIKLHVDKSEESSVIYL